MSADLIDAINRLHELDYTQSPLQVSKLREKALVDGLNALAAYYDKEIDYTYRDSLGDLKFNVKGADRGAGEFGDALAQQLRKIPTRMGLTATTGYVMASSNWLWINHFEAEKLLKMVGEELFDIAVEPRSTKAGL